MTKLPSAVSPVDQETPPPSSLRTLGPPVRDHLLEGTSVGRVGLRNHEGQQQVPVNYVCRGLAATDRSSSEWRRTRSPGDGCASRGSISEDHSR